MIYVTQLTHEWVIIDLFRDNQSQVTGLSSFYSLLSIITDVTFTDVPMFLIYAP